MIQHKRIMLAENKNKHSKPVMCKEKCQHFSHLKTYREKVLIFFKKNKQLLD